MSVTLLVIFIIVLKDYPSTY